jgi:SSS family solute:Na+ symporter
MNALDYLVLFGTLLGIAAYGSWATRNRSDMKSYLKGAGDTRWIAIGVSVMATQASAVTFLSLPGQAFESGMSFIQNYFGAALALIIICIFFLPILRSLNVYTAYEYLVPGSFFSSGASRRESRSMPLRSCSRPFSAGRWRPPS